MSPVELLLWAAAWEVAFILPPTDYRHRAGGQAALLVCLRAHRLNLETENMS